MISFDAIAMSRFDWHSVGKLNGTLFGDSIEVVHPLVAEFGLLVDAISSNAH